MCSVCQLARATLQQDTTCLISKFVFPSQPASPSPDSHAPVVRSQCTKCLTYTGRGLSHVCTKNTRRANQTNAVKSSSAKTKSKVTSNLVKHIFDEQGVEKRGGTALLETGSKPLRVSLGLGLKTTGVVKPRRFDHQSMMRLQTACNLSDKTLL